MVAEIDGGVLRHELILTLVHSHENVTLVDGLDQDMA